MRPEDVDYVEFRIERARQTLAEARHLLAGGFTVGVVNRLYYACFYSVSALLLSEGHSSSKHSGIMSLFDRHWIKPGRLPAHLGELYHLLFAQRQKGDYEDLYAFEPSELERWVSETQEFLHEVETHTTQGR
jgi:uncharacterized protein (UPF0332 family)